MTEVGSGLIDSPRPMGSFFETVRQRWSIPLGKVAGVPIFSHLTFWMVMIFLAGIGPALLVLGVCSLLAHVFGHVLTAKRLGVTTKEVLLLPFGAAAEMPNLPAGTRKELAIALAGPAVSMGLSIIFIGLSFLLPAPELAVNFPYWSTPQEVCFYMGVFNGAIGIFNLIPAFPMDGGRVLRSSLALHMDILKATKITAAIALVFSAVGGGLALWSGDFVLFLIAGFVFLASQGEYYALKKKEEDKIRHQMIDAFETMMENPEMEHREEAEMVLKLLKAEPEPRPKPTISLGKYLTVLALAAIIWSYVSDLVYLGVMAAGGVHWMGVVASVAFVLLALVVTMKVAKPLYRAQENHEPI